MEFKTFFIKAKNPEKEGELRKLLEEKGFQHVEENPDFIVSFGGDGTFLICERKWPGVPKLLVRDSMICFTCHDEPIADVIEKLANGDCFIQEYMKIEATYGDEKFVGVNDIIIRNKDPTKGIRFKVSVDGKEIGDLFIGDGLVVAASFGATGYYHSITKQTFEKGIGIALNNVTKKFDPLVVDENSEISVHIIRGDGELAADNNPHVLTVVEDDVIKIKKHSEVAKVITHG